MPAGLTRHDGGWGRSSGRHALTEPIPTPAPHLARTSAEWLAAGFDYGAEFEWGLDVVLEAIERAAGAASG